MKLPIANRRRILMHKIEEIFDIKKGDIISITGAGGKTSLMVSLALALSKKGRVLWTTSTKIAMPEKGFDRIFTSFGDYFDDKSAMSLCLGEKVPGVDKLSSIGYENLKKIKDDFDYVLIEADGCRNLPLKFWYPHEPVIYDFSTKVIAILPVKIIGRNVSPDFIYNYEGFSKNIGTGIIDTEKINKIIAYDNGFYKDFDKEKYFFFNQVESEKDFKFIEGFKEAFNFSDIKLIYGSVKEGKFYEN